MTLYRVSLVDGTTCSLLADSPEEAIMLRAGCPLHAVCTPVWEHADAGIACYLPADSTQRYWIISIAPLEKT